MFKYIPERHYCLGGPFLLICFLLIFPVGVHAQKDLSLEQIALALQDNYSKITSCRFDFTQVVRTAGREQKGGGDAVFYRSQARKATREPQQPLNVMRWNYYYPDVQIIINDGKTLSMYIKKDKQMIITPTSELESDITFALLTGSKSILDDFRVSPAGNRFTYSDSAGKTKAMQLIPIKPNSQIKSVFIWFDENYIIHRLIIEDYFDSITELLFTNCKINTIPAASEQELEKIIYLPIPPDTEIISR